VGEEEVAAGEAGEVGEAWVPEGEAEEEEARR